MATSLFPLANTTLNTPSTLGAFSSTPKVNPSVASGLSITPAASGGQALLGGQPVQSSGQQATNAVLSGLLPTSSGGVSFNPAHASAYNTAPTPAASAPTQAGLSQFVTNPNPTSGGGSLSTNANGTPVGYAPSAGYTIDTSGATPSSALSGQNTASGLQSSYGGYADYVNALSQAQGYSPAYIAAQQAQYGAQAQGAQLSANAANINANVATGIGTTGLTQGQAQTLTGQEQALNSQQQQTNAIQQLSANQSLNTQQLARTGAISAAQTQLQYSPEGEAGSNAITQYNALQQQYPGANIPEYNQSLTPEQNQQVASYIVANSPAYKAGFQSTYATPGGGTGIYSKLDVGSGGFQQNQDGSYTLVPAAAAALGSANANVVQTQLGNLSNINSAINASTKTLSTTQQFMNQYGLNQSGVSILSQIQNSTNKQLDKAGAVAGLNADLNALRSDYAQYLIGRGGSVAGTNEEASAAIPDTISPAQLQTLVQQMQQDGQNAADAVSTQVNQALSGITNNTVPGSSAGGSTSGSIYDF